ncbi:hypothetical protein [Microbacterium indicum]|uniref:hypothetical protein n=1 Tax=Microbacterium indicum TaxID=358100 RepID=UPI0004290760|nr:hypothetical protein [Microbacterium indicum]
MDLSLAPIDAERFPAWRARCHAEYVADLVDSGEDPRSAERHAQASLAQAFPDNGPTDDHAVFDLVHDVDGIVGYLWIGRDSSGDPASW